MHSTNFLLSSSQFQALAMPIRSASQRAPDKKLLPVPVRNASNSKREFLWDPNFVTGEDRYNILLSLHEVVGRHKASNINVP